MADARGSRWRTWLREPLVHFLVLGALLFLVYWIRGGGAAALGSNLIVVPASAVDGLRESWQATWARDPTAAELDVLIEDYVREEILYREALALGLDRDDPVVKRRMREKLEFVLEDLAQPEEPDDAELEAYLEAHADEFRIPPSFTFEQVFLSRDRGDAAHAESERLAAQLRAGAPAADLGDRFPLGRSFESLASRDVERIFGPPFARALLNVEIGRWSGPIESSHGLHLVRVSERVAGRGPTLDEARSAVLRDYDEAQRREANAARYRELRQRYTVEIAAAASERKAAASERAGQEQ